MDTSRFRNIFRLFDEDADYTDSTTFQEELNRQCNLILVPAAIVAIFSWLPYIPLDRDLYGGIIIIVFFRLGFALTGVLSLILHFTPLFREKNYWLLFSLIYYMELASPVIAGLVRADAAYMGGYAMLILAIPLMPFRKKHSFIMMASSLFLFMVIIIVLNTKFSLPVTSYGLYNVVTASTASFIGILVLDNIRKVSYEKNRLDYIANMQLKVATMEIYQINEELKKTNLLKSKLLELAANDLQKPLQDIMECAQSLQGEIKADRSPGKELEAIYKSSGNMIKLITKLLKSLSIESGKLVLNKTHIDAGKLAESVIDAAKPYLEKKKQPLFFKVEGECLVDGDELLLQEILENLLSNASKFSPPGRSIWIGIDRHDAVVTFKVRDEGPGLNEEDKEKLFNRFQKLSAKPTAGESSTGLGLAITHDLVAMHNGRIWVESEPGRGCTFIVEIPKAGA